MSKIVQIFEKFNATISGGEDPLLSCDVLSSVMADRLRSELNKLGVQWDGQPVLLSKIKSRETGIDKEISSAERPTENYGGIPILVGTDIQFIDEFPISKDFWGEQFYIDNFKDSEIAHATSKEHPIETFAGIYCAKEAIFKANNQIPRAEIEIYYRDGKPNYGDFSLSISHSQSYAVATALHSNIKQKLSRSDEAGSKTSAASSKDIERIDLAPKNSSRKVFLIAIIGAILVNIVWWALENFM